MTSKKRSGKMQAERVPPDREIDKMQAIRHLAHASIRMLFWEEDPFALHIICQSCDKLITDCMKADGITSSGDFAHFVKSEYLSDFYTIYRETYNYFKHADTDRHIKLGVRNIVRLNEILIITNLARLLEMAFPQTAHVDYFFRYAGLVMPKMYPVPALKPFHLRGDLDLLVRSELLEAMRRLVSVDPKFRAEKDEDLTDLAALAETTIKHYN